MNRLHRTHRTIRSFLLASLATHLLCRTTLIGAIYVSQYGAVGDGVTDDTVSIQNAIYAADISDYASSEIGGQTVHLDANKVYRILGDLVLRPDVALVGTYVNDNNASTIDWTGGSASKIKLSSSKQIKMYNGSQLKGVIIYRDGMTSPVTDENLFSGTPVKIYSADAFISNVAILGFYMGIDTDIVNTPRVKIESSNIDCKYGVRLDTSLDVSRLDYVQVYPYLTSADPTKVRSGQAFVIKANDWTRLTNCSTYSYLTGYLLDATNSTVLLNCESSHYVGGSRVGKGIETRNYSAETLMYDCTFTDHAEGIRINTTSYLANIVRECSVLRNTDGIYVTGGDACIAGGNITGYSQTACDGVVANNTASRVIVRTVAFSTLYRAMYKVASESFLYGSNTFTNVTYQFSP